MYSTAYFDHGRSNAGVSGTTKLELLILKSLYKLIII